ncbi:MAG: DUF6326 family protein [Bacteroidota bacterium]
MKHLWMALLGLFSAAMLPGQVRLQHNVLAATYQIVPLATELPSFDQMDRIRPLEMPPSFKQETRFVPLMSDAARITPSLLGPRLSPQIKLNLPTQSPSFMDKNRRNIYSALWAFTCLNYLYADLVGVMDVNLLTQYQTGTVNGIDITPGFLTIAAAYMQLPLANVFLPQVIKNERTLRWVQIASGSIATLVQAATLFVGEPSPYYSLFSAIEIGTTAFITIDAIRWKAKKRK